MIPIRKPFFVSQQNKIELEKIISLRDKHPVNILIKGKHGMGKSELARQIAAVYKMEYYPIPIGSLQETGQLMGHDELIGGETRFVEGKFPKAIKSPNSLVHLEELNRPESPKALNDLFPILDDGRMLVHEKLGEVGVAKGVVFVATLNEGFEYTGIDPLDAALEDRFHIIHLDYLTPVHESNLVMMRTGMTGEPLTKLLQFANKLRMDGQEPIHISTRRILMVAELMVAGLGLRDALVANLALDKDKLESILLNMDFSGQGQDIVAGKSSVEFVLL